MHNEKRIDLLMTKIMEGDLQWLYMVKMLLKN
jgi:hypothetical protein